MNLRREVVTHVGTFARGCPLHVVERLGGHYIVDVGLDRHEILMAIPEDAFDER
jgi:hypothetical protein